MNRKTVILITGPTASGKTSLALQLARHYSTAIISADSRQCYRELNIGVAKPSAEELAGVRHYFINSHSVHDTVSAGVFADYATDAANEILAHHHVAIMAGGTGLYIKAFIEGLDGIPDIPASIREQIIRQYEEKGIDWLQKEVEDHDPLYYRKDRS